jgi:probable HAF family extracellular repeat protein
MNKTKVSTPSQLTNPLTPLARALRLALGGSLFGLAALSLPVQAADTFIGLGDLANGNFRSIAYGVSADGAVVVGYGTSGTNNANSIEAFRWTSTDGMVGLGDLAGGSFISLARGVSADGAVVVGPGSGTNGSEAFRWTSVGGMVGLGNLTGRRGNSEAIGASADGAVVVGRSYNSTSDYEAFRWTPVVNGAGGMVGLGDLAGGYFDSLARGVSADGAVVVGYGNSANGIQGAASTEAFRWTPVVNGAGGMVGLGDLAGGDFYSTATGVSADGAVVVGRSNSTSGVEAFRWTPVVNGAGGMVGLGDLAGGGFDSTAYGVSADGAVVVGQSIGTTNDYEAFRWTPVVNGVGGMVTVASWLAAADVTVTPGYIMNEALGVSADGRLCRRLGGGGLCDWPIRL